MSKCGSKPGERRGGRAKGVPNKATKEAKLALEDLAKSHSEAALQALVDVATKGESEAARVSAAVAILDRGYGKPRQALEHSGGINVRNVTDLTDDELAKIAAGIL